MTAAHTIAGVPILSAQICEPRVGRWTADVEADTAEDITGSVTLTLGSVTLVGTVHRGGLDSGRWSGRIVGGTGGLSTTLNPKNYAGATLQHVVDDIIRESGETLDSASTSLIGHVTANWHRTRGPASHALQAVADELSVPWRVTRSGTVLLGAQTATALTTTEVQVLDRPESGALLVAPAGDPELRPGVLFGDRVISYVATLIGAGKIRQELWFDDVAGTTLGRVKGSLLRLIDAAVGRKLLYSYLWPCTVASQAGDGSVELIPDDEEIRGGGLGRVFIRHGEPGYACEPGVGRTGARCLVGFEAGDPKRPYVAHWLRNTEVTTVTFGAGTQSIARTNDTIQAGFFLWDAATLKLWWAPDNGLGLGIAGAYVEILANPNTPNPPPAATPGTPIEGDITSGNPKLKA